MNWAAIALYLPTAFVSTLMPGPSALLALSHGASFGPLRTLYTAAGINAAVLAMMFVSYLGAGSIAAWLDGHFFVYRAVCALVLVAIGLQMIFSRGAGPAADASATAPAAAPAASNARLFATGFLVSAGNPKALLFFFLLFPSFIDGSGARAAQFAVLALIWLACEFFGLMVYAVAGQRLLRWLADRGGLRTLNVICGVSILLLAAVSWFVVPAGRVAA
jgi:homoserine/homoserine lactone efflux protein